MLFLSALTAQRLDIVAKNFPTSDKRLQKLGTLKPSLAHSQPAPSSCHPEYVDRSRADSEPRCRLHCLSLRASVSLNGMNNSIYLLTACVEVGLCSFRGNRKYGQEVTNEMKLNKEFKNFNHYFATSAFFFINCTVAFIEGCF